MDETFMVYHPSGAPDDVVSIQSGTYQFCRERLAEWQRNEVGVYDIGFFDSRDEAGEFIRTRGLHLL